MIWGVPHLWNPPYSDFLKKEMKWSSLVLDKLTMPGLVTGDLGWWLPGPGESSSNSRWFKQPQYGKWLKCPPWFLLSILSPSLQCTFLWNHLKSLGYSKTGNFSRATWEKWGITGVESREQVPGKKPRLCTGQPAWRPDNQITKSYTWKKTKQYV